MQALYVAYIDGFKRKFFGGLSAPGEGTRMFERYMLVSMNKALRYRPQHANILHPYYIGTPKGYANILHPYYRDPTPQFREIPTLFRGLEFLEKSLCRVSRTRPPWYMAVSQNKGTPIYNVYLYIYIPYKPLDSRVPLILGNPEPYMSLYIPINK